MRELSHSDRFPKQLKSKKKVNSQKVTWHSLEVTRGSGRSDMWKQWRQVTGQMMHTWTNGRVTLVNFRTNVVVPRGPGMGSHVAPSQQLCGKFQNVLGSMGFEPMTYGQARALVMDKPPTRHVFACLNKPTL
jgi:hypothetical protein